MRLFKIESPLRTAGGSAKVFPVIIIMTMVVLAMSGIMIMVVLATGSANTKPTLNNDSQSHTHLSEISIANIIHQNSIKEINN